jgi:hypothetical protein
MFVGQFSCDTFFLFLGCNNCQFVNSWYSGQPWITTEKQKKREITPCLGLGTCKQQSVILLVDEILIAVFNILTFVSAFLTVTTPRLKKVTVDVITLERGYKFVLALCFVKH